MSCTGDRGEGFQGRSTRCAVHGAQHVQPSGRIPRAHHQEVVSGKQNQDYVNISCLLVSTESNCPSIVYIHGTILHDNTVTVTAPLVLWMRLMHCLCCFVWSSGYVSTLNAVIVIYYIILLEILIQHILRHTFCHTLVYLLCSCVVVCVILWYWRSLVAPVIVYVANIIVRGLHEEDNIIYL